MAKAPKAPARRRKKRAPISKKAPDPAPAESVTKRIMRRDGRWCVEGKESGQSFGCYATEAEAQQRLRQIEAFKGDPIIFSIEKRLPFVLTPDACAGGLMPALGTSAMPPSLEQDVPVKWRYWLAKDDDTARAVRDSLVEAQLFSSGSIMRVQGELRRVVKQTKIFLSDVGTDPEPLEEREDVEVCASRFVKVAEGDLSVISSEVVDVLDPERVEKFLEARRPWMAVLADSSDRAGSVVGIAKNLFRVRTRPGVSFATSEEVASNPLVEVPREVDPEVQAVLEKSITIAKEEGQDEQFVLGIVLEPEEVDTQNDVVSAEDIRQTAHKFMREYRQIGLMHRAMVTDKVTILESFIAPADFTIGGQLVKKGSWLLGLRIEDQDLWTAVKSGQLNAFSIGGSGIRIPELTE